ncbi:phosphatase PAP2 family protein [Pedobacter metabolipauper]|uniref:PAP2 superfamily protein n=1 Tax=Pedobacter metabolipauper TaxID=425513 RepID=A0A4R6T055_9SPHI|nr:phosphatase PAP2 family protein [Pedobacter metabolipauper]TDQ10938.1 PAP2 superfamily protein [Pedobacter metabolipauper]
MFKQLLTALIFLSTPLFSLGQDQDSIPAPAKTKIKGSSFIIPSVFIGYGLISLMGDNPIRTLDLTTNAELQEDHPSFALKADNYLRYAPAVAVYGLDLIGVKAKNTVVDRSIMLITSYAIVSVGVGAIKLTANRLRPNGANRHSFPSGHTSLAFMTAEFLHQEYKDQSIWYSVGGYALATGTGILRLYNNAHWVSDVVAGAGFGILSTKVTYLIYPYIKRKLFHGKSPDMAFSPGYQNGMMSFTLTKRL